MGFNFSKESESVPADTTERQGYTRIEPAFGSSGNGREAAGPSSNLNSSAVRNFPGRDGGSITLKNNVISCTWKNGVKEITIIRDMIIIQNDFDSKMELEGSHDFQVEGFHIRTRRILERSNGKHGYCVGIDTTALDANTFEITNDNENKPTVGSTETILKVKGKKQSEILNMQILVRNELREQDTSSSSSSTPGSVSIAPVNSSGIVWIKTYY